MIVKLAFDLFHHLKSHGAGKRKRKADPGSGRFGVGELIHILNSRGASLRESEAPRADREKVKQD
jgi:hypothetical protein